MSSIVRAVLVLVVILIVGGGAALAMWNIPAPAAKVEKAIPDDRLQH